MGELMSILILDDDEKWLALHERRLRQAGFKCRATQLAKEAIEIAKTDPTVKFALLDEILFVPPVPVEGKTGELQRWQGSGVVREIANHRRDVQIIMVTSAPQLRSQGDSKLFTKETAKLRRQRGVIDIIHKQAIDEDPDGEYGWLVELISRPLSDIKIEIVKPRLLIGLGVNPEVLNGSKYKRLRQCLKETGTSEYELDGTVKRFLGKLQPTEKAVFIEMPGSKKLDRTSSIKPDSQSFQILEILAQRSEQRSEVEICEQDYHYAARKSGTGVDTSTELDRRVVQDFAFGYNSQGRKGLQLGVQIEARSHTSSRLKVAIHRLSQQLVKLNVGTPGQLFSSDQGCYRPTFDLGIVLYAIEAGKQQKKRP
ncbi:MAG TPA: hypothetical protein DDW76_30745 [Cyanobacteria bacterium UBA11369]|nr:hypothetical protein [Cyanobacteria bacterium UBA11371]HBE31514.1 hypothetical protein [Cyanobacteria bacterium UBA11368]HBE53024.1 hypothetical protein [Cyanobacteria bacterium UBA11369]